MKFTLLVGIWQRQLTTQPLFTCPKSTMLIPITANFAQISHIVLVFSLLTLGKQILVGNNNKEAKKSIQKNLNKQFPKFSRCPWMQGPNIMIANQKHERSWVIWAFSSHVMVNSINIKLLLLLYRVSYCANASNEKKCSYVYLTIFNPFGVITSKKIWKV